MNDERLGQEIADFYRETDIAPPDSHESAREVAARLPRVVQVKRRRWRPSWLIRADHETSPIPASNGQTPTVIGRTSAMISPAKAITAGAVVFAIGAMMLIAQPLNEQSIAPGAEVGAGPTESTPFTMSFVWFDQPVQAGEEIADGGVNKTIGDCYAMGVAGPSDPRMDGAVTYCGGEHVYGEVRDESTYVWTATYRIVNDDGAWQGSHTGVVWDDPSGERMDRGGDFVVLTGEGAYDGLYAAISLPWSDVNGVIFEGAPPVGPILPSAE